MLAFAYFMIRVRRVAALQLVRDSGLELGTSEFRTVSQPTILSMRSDDVKDN